MAQGVELPVKNKRLLESKEIFCFENKKRPSGLWLLIIWLCFPIGKHSQ